MTRARAQVNEETQKAQLPWGHTNLIGSVYINSAAQPTPATPVALGFAQRSRWRPVTERRRWSSPVA